MRKENNLFTSAISNVVTIIISVVIGINLTPLIIKNIGEAAFGQYSLSLSIVGYVLAIASVLDSSIIVILSKIKDNQSKESISKTVSNSFIFYIVVSLVMLVFSGIIALFFYDYISAEFVSFRKEFLILSFAYVFNVLTMFFVSLATSTESFISINIFNTVCLLIRFVLVLVAFFFNRSFEFLAYAELVSSGVKFILFFFLRDKKFKQTLKPSLFDKVEFLSIFNVVKKSVVVFFATLLKGQLNSIVIAKYISITMVGHYTIAITFMSYISSLVMGAFNVLAPRFSKLVGTDQEDKLSNYLFTAVTLSSIVSYGFVVMVYFLGNRMIELWVGVSYQVSFEYVLILLVGFSISTAQYPVISLFYSKNKQHIFGYLAFAEGVSCFVLSLILVRSMGAHGVVWALSGPLFLSKLIIQPLIATKYLDLNYARFMKSFLAPSVLVIPFFVISYYFNLDSQYSKSLSTVAYFQMFIVMALLYIVLSSMFLYLYILKERKR